MAPIPVPGSVQCDGAIKDWRRNITPCLVDGKYLKEKMIVIFEISSKTTTKFFLCGDLFFRFCRIQNHQKTKKNPVAKYCPKWDLISGHLTFQSCTLRLS